MTHDSGTPVIPSVDDRSAPNQADTQIPSDERELAHIAQEIYRRNAELMLRNRTLSTLSKIYQIINTTLGVEDTAQRVTDAVTAELGFLKSFIAIVDNEKKLLKVVAVSTPKDPEAQQVDGVLRSLVIPLSAQENMCVSAITKKKRRLTNSLHDVVIPQIRVAEASSIQKALSVQSFIIDPIIFAGEVLGVFVIGLSKHIGYLSKAETEAIRGIIDVVGIALEKAQIYKNLEDANKKP